MEKVSPTIPSGQARPLPWWKFYPRDWTCNPVIRTLSPEARGVVLDLMCAQWESTTGWVAAKNETELTRMARCPVKTLRRVWREIASTHLIEEEFDDALRTVIFRFPFLHEIHIESSSRVENLRKAGRVSASKRKESNGTEHMLNNCPANGGETQTQTQTQIKTTSKPCTSQSDAQDGSQSFQLSSEATPAPKGKTPDPRHQPVRDAIKNDYKNRFCIDCPWDGSDARALDQFLKGNPHWTVEQIGAMVMNRFQSQDINSARPRLWLSRLGDYAGGVHNQYGRVGPTAPESAGEARVRRTNESIARVFGEDIAAQCGSSQYQRPSARIERQQRTDERIMRSLLEHRMRNESGAKTLDAVTEDDGPSLERIPQ
jgi:hypothetical protein